MATERTATVTILFTDLVASTQMLDRLGDDSATEVHRAHFRILREAIAGSGGEEIKSLGDGLMVVFLSALDAVGCAVAMQRAVSSHNDEDDETSCMVRVGIHAGEPIREGGDYFGTPVVVAKRLCDLARGGQILVSALVAGLVDPRRQFALRDLGPLALRGIDNPIDAREVLWADPDAPPTPTVPGVTPRWRSRRSGLLAAGRRAVPPVVTSTTSRGSSLDLGATLPGEATAVVSGDAVSETAIHLGAGQVVTIRVVVVGNQWYPLVQLLAPDGSVIAFDDDVTGGTSPTIVKFPIPADGAYRARVTKGGRDGGRYRITFSADTPAPAKNGATTVVHRFGSAGPPITFIGVAGQTATITVTPNPAEVFAPTVTLVDSAGQRVASVGPRRDGTTRLTSRLPATGLYTVAVGARNGGVTSYRVDGEIV